MTHRTSLLKFRVQIDDMKKTKKKILAAALKQFNEKGIVNVRLQHIADEAFISVGNLAYHFSNKEAIVEKLYELLKEEQLALLKEYRIVPLFDNINHLIINTFDLQQNYRFFYLDTLEVTRAYPEIYHQHQEHINHQILQWRTILDFNVSRGALQKPPIVKNLNELATHIWMTADLWLYQNMVRSQTPIQVESYQKAIWGLIIPYFTDMGRREYTQMLELSVKNNYF